MLERILSQAESLEKLSRNNYEYQRHIEETYIGAVGALGFLASHAQSLAVDAFAESPARDITDFKKGVLLGGLIARTTFTAEAEVQMQVACDEFDKRLAYAKSSRHEGMSKTAASSIFLEKTGLAGFRLFPGLQDITMDIAKHVLVNRLDFSAFLKGCGTTLWINHLAGLKALELILETLKDEELEYDISRLLSGREPPN